MCNSVVYRLYIDCVFTTPGQVSFHHHLSPLYPLLPHPPCIIICNTKKLETMLTSDKGRLNYGAHAMEYYAAIKRNGRSLCTEKERCLYSINGLKNNLYEYICYDPCYVKIPSTPHDPVSSRDPVHLFLYI